MSVLAQKRYTAMTEKLKASGLKSTPQRLAIIRVLAESPGHPSVENICVRLRQDFPGISPATVYRNIILIKSLGEAYEIALAGAGNRYDGRKPYPHPHVVCLGCGAIIDPEMASLHDLTREVAAASGFEVRSFRLDFFGTCPDCLNKNKKTISQKRRKT